MIFFIQKKLLVLLCSKNICGITTAISTGENDSILTESYINLKSKQIDIHFLVTNRNCIVRIERNRPSVWTLPSSYSLQLLPSLCDPPLSPLRSRQVQTRQTSWTSSQQHFLHSRMWCSIYKQNQEMWAVVTPCEMINSGEVLCSLLYSHHSLHPSHQRASCSFSSFVHSVSLTSFSSFLLSLQSKWLVFL